MTSLKNLWWWKCWQKTTIAENKSNLGDDGHLHLLLDRLHVEGGWDRLWEGGGRGEGQLGGGEGVSLEAQLNLSSPLGELGAALFSELTSTHCICVCVSVHYLCFDTLFWTLEPNKRGSENCVTLFFWWIIFYSSLYTIYMNAKTFFLCRQFPIFVRLTVWLSGLGTQGPILGEVFILLDISNTRPPTQLFRLLNKSNTYIPPTPPLFLSC